MRALKILILFIVVLSGCSKKYLDSREEEFFSRRVLAAWDDIEGRVISGDEKGFTMGLQVKNFVEVRDSLRLKEVYMRGYEAEDGIIEQNFFLGFSEVIGGCTIVGFSCLTGCAYYYRSSTNIPNPVPVEIAVAVLIPVGIAGFSLMMDGLPQYVKSIKKIPAHVRLDTLCVGEKLLSDEDVKIVLENTNFEKIYYTNEYGNIELKFNEIIPEPTKADSVLNIIVRYAELIDTVDVRIK
jgi:hypothetical protein